MRLEILLSHPEGLLLDVAARNLALPLVVNYSDEGVSSCHIPEESLVTWAKARLQLQTELFYLGMRKQSRREEIVDRLLTVVNSVRKQKSSAIQSVLRSHT